jgi:hypothetical protein
MFGSGLQPKVSLRLLRTLAENLHCSEQQPFALLRKKIGRPSGG